MDEYGGRTVTVRLQAIVSGYKAGLAQASASTKAFAREISGAGETGKQNLRQLGTEATIAAGVIGAGLGFMIARASAFDETMSNVQAVTGATAVEMIGLRDAALDAGEATVFSATEAATATAELAKAGVSTGDILRGGLRGALDLASAGGLDLAQAAETAAQAMTTFNLTGADVPRIADTLAAAANKSAADVDDMAIALKQSGQVAAQVGLDIETTSGALALFAQNGLRGSDAGTSLRTMLLRLNPTSEEASKTMKALGIDFYDSEGRFVGLAGAAEQLRTKMAGLTDEQRVQAMTTIFGQDAIRGASILYRTGAAGVDQWTSAVSDSGYAAELARVKTDNLRGDIEQLGGAIETGLIQTGQQADGVLRGIVQGATDAVRGLNTLPGPAQAAAGGFLAVTAGVLGTAGAVSTVLPRWREMRSTLEAMGGAGSALSKGVSAATTALAVATPGLIYASAVWGDINEKANDYVEALKAQAGPVKTLEDQRVLINDLVGAYNAAKEALKQYDDDFLSRGDQSFFQLLPGGPGNDIEELEAITQRLSTEINSLMPGFERWQGALSEISTETGLTTEEVQNLADGAGIDLRGGMAALSEATGKSVAELEEMGVKSEEVDKGFDADKEAILAYKDSLQVGTPATREMSGALGVLGDDVSSVEDKMKAFKDTLDSLFGAAFTEEEARDRLQRDLNRLPELLQKAGYNWQGTTDEAIAYRDALRSTTEDAGDIITAWREQGITGEELRRKVEGLKWELIAQAQALGVPTEAAGEYLGVLDAIPDDIYTSVTVAGLDDANREAQALLDRLNLLRGRPLTDDEVHARIREARDTRLSESAIDKIRQMQDAAKGAGRALGGRMYPGVWHPVLERGEPEMLSTGSGEYLVGVGAGGGYMTPLSQIPGAQGGAGTGGGNSLVQNFHGVPLEQAMQQAEHRQRRFLSAVN